MLMMMINKPYIHQRHCTFLIVNFGNFWPKNAHVYVHFAYCVCMCIVYVHLYLHVFQLMHEFVQGYVHVLVQNVFMCICVCVHAMMMQVDVEKDTEDSPH